MLFAAGSTLVEPDESHGRLVVFFETSEVMPPDFFVYGFVQALGKRGLLDRIAALLVGRPKTECLGQQAVGGKEAYAQNQKSAVLRGLKEHFADKESAETELPFPVA